MQAPARVYALTEQEADASNIVVSGALFIARVLGTLFIASHPAYVPFDIGATHSFIAVAFIRKFGIPCTYLRDGLLVDTPTSGQVLYDRKVKLCFAN